MIGLFFFGHLHLTTEVEALGVQQRPAAVQPCDGHEHVLPRMKQSGTAGLFTPWGLPKTSSKPNFYEGSHEMSDGPHHSGASDAKTNMYV